MWDSIIKPALVLFLVCAIIAGLLAFVNINTKDQIEKQAIMAQIEARQQVLPEAGSFEPIDVLPFVKDTDLQDVVKEAYKGMKDGNLVGYVFSVSNKGYAGEVPITVGIDITGQIKGINVGDNAETPGLGKKAGEKEFLSQFEGITPKESLQVVKTEKTKDEEIQAISGATITSRAVTNSVEAALRVARELIKEGK